MWYFIDKNHTCSEPNKKQVSLKAKRIIEKALFLQAFQCKFHRKFGFT